MKLKREVARWVVVLVGCGCLGGCATGAIPGFRPRNPSPPAPDAASRDAKRADTGKAGASSKETARLAAIEEFLARTAEYESPESATADLDGSSRQVGTNDMRSRLRSATQRDGGLPFGQSMPADGGAHHPSEHVGATHADRAAANAQMSVSVAQPGTPRPALPTILSVGVRPASLVDSDRHDDTQDDHPSGMTNVALNVHDEPAAFRFDDWLADLEVEAAQGRNIAAEWKLRLVELAIGRDVTRVELGSTLTDETRSLLGSLLETVQAVREVVADPIARGETALARAESLRQALADRSDPVVTTVALCQRVVTFGVYEEMQPDTLISGRDIQAIIYSEIENLHAEVTGAGQFETRLTTRLELFDTSGASVWLKEEPEIVDLCRRRRRDFFIAQRVTFPPTLPAGAYTLKVGIEDLHAGRAAEQAYPLTIQSPVSVARIR